MKVLNTISCSLVNQLAHFSIARAFLIRALSYPHPSSLSIPVPNCYWHGFEYGRVVGLGCSCDQESSTAICRTSPRAPYPSQDLSQFYLEPAPQNARPLHLGDYGILEYNNEEGPRFRAVSFIAEPLAYC